MLTALGFNIASMALEHPKHIIHQEQPSQNVTTAVVLVDPYRPPQRNDDNASNRCNCPCARGVSEMDTDRIVADHGQNVPEDIDQYEFIDSYFPCDKESAGGDEGVEKHLMLDEGGPLSPCPSSDEEISPDASMIVEPGSREISMESSLATLSSRNSSVFAFSGGWAESIFISIPLRLTPEVAHCYPSELDLT